MAKDHAEGAYGKKPSKWGKGKTDPESWWKKGGASPNPAGRPKGSKNQKTVYKEAFGAKIVVAFDGAEKEMTKGELGYHQVASKSAAGDLKAFLIQKELDEKYDPVETAPPTPEETAADYHTFKTHLELLQKFMVFRNEEAAELAAQQQPADGDESDGADDEEGGHFEDEDGPDADG